MKEHKFPLESFIGGWYMDEKICDGIVDLFKENPQEQRPGVIGGPFSVNKKHKDSIDIGVDCLADNLVRSQRRLGAFCAVLPVEGTIDMVYVHV